MVAKMTYESPNFQPRPLSCLSIDLLSGNIIACFILSFTRTSMSFIAQKVVMVSYASPTFI